ncbi:hypothetical protein ACS8FD_05370 [Psychrobacter sp. 1U2]|uniref:hypothetical protein n=1 Tax=Psychrobacter sp. 1U2 TaxID=3453577 RepID=UPI003F44C6F9
MSAPLNVALIVHRLQEASINQKFAEYKISQILDGLDNKCQVSTRMQTFLQKFMVRFVDFAANTSA